MGDPAEENDPPPESFKFLTKGYPCVNRKKQKKVIAFVKPLSLQFLNERQL